MFCTAIAKDEENVASITIAFIRISILSSSHSNGRDAKIFRNLSKFVELNVDLLIC